ncbi:MAG: glycosyltransferase 87 family protein [Paraburkholderia sp.]|jgi:hypothetical protein|uniref:glycosyltransferase 87 family protein n=1 Tax=Burkholderiaceae TaxID=119060 RepID=UPI0010F4B5DD|nr:glycosyltransferase 87 family protein [Burkholderia sp. 4M9327F10]
MATVEGKIRRESLWRRLRSVDLNTPRALASARVAVPLLFGLWSLWLGQDRNWDLFNYHLYNAYAFLHDKLHTDFAPAGMQTYFNPVLDLGYYLLNAYLPAPLAGFLMGAIHGLNFVLLLAIARRVLPDLPAEDRYRVPLLLALAGVLTANFLSELGNTMGDDTTALFSLASLLLLVTSWHRLGSGSAKSLGMAVLGGLLVGLGMGLKLTNVVYAVALCASLLLFPATPAVRIRLVFLFGIGVLIGLAVTGGYWLWKMWETFGNPTFPQFSSVFPNPLTPSVGVADTSWLPKSVLETVFWPFLFSLHSKRVGQVTLHQWIWPVVYVLFWAWVIVSCVRARRASSRGKPLDPRARYVIAFVALGYALWVKLFSIYRYVVPMELLTPLVAYVLLTQLFSYLTARRIAAWTLCATTLVVVLGGVETWGHESWASEAFRAETPELDSPNTTTVIIVGGDPAWGWLATLFPPSVAFTQIGGNFPGTPLYDEHVRAMVRQRGGPTFALFQTRYNWRVEYVAKMNRIADMLGLIGSTQACNRLQWVVSRLHLHASVQWLPGATHESACQLGLRADDVRDLEAEKRQLAEQARPVLERSGFLIDPLSCTIHRAYAGKGIYPYQWCRVTLNKAAG